MELLLDYEYSSSLIQLFPKFSYDFLIKVNYSLRLLKLFEYSASFTLALNIFLDTFNLSNFSVHFWFLRH